jgi:hypothetical protein
MGEPDEKDYNGNDLMSLARGIESNMLYLQAMREMPGVLPEHVEPLEIAIEAQVKLLNNLSDAMGSPDRARKDVSIGDLGTVGTDLGANVTHLKM